ncbi:MAG: DNA polymerase [Minisyncoccia bacterium]
MEKEKNKKLVLLDSHAIIHRAYHALPDFVSSKGEPTGALYGLSTMLLAIITELKPDYIVACFDLPKPTYRHEAYKDYKAGRAKTDEGLISQLKRSRNIFTALNIPIYDKEGFEADDIIGTIVEETKKIKNLEVVIASGDMDTLQLVEDGRVKVYTLKKGIKDTIIYDEKAVVARFGFLPKLLVDYKGLRGDPSDNIIGIKGIGEKTAEILIQNFGTIEDIYKKLKNDTNAFKNVKITERIVNLLKDGEEEASFSKMLATIRRDAPIDFVLPEKTWKENFDVSKIKQLWAELDFRTLGSRLDDVLKGSVILNKVKQPNKSESGLLRDYTNTDGNSTADEGTFGSKEYIFKQKELFIATWLLNSNTTNPTLEEVFDLTGLSAMPVHVGQAGIKDLDSAKAILMKDLENKGLKNVFEKIEKPLIPIILEMEKTGVKINKKEVEDLSKEYHTELSKKEKKIWELSGTEFNINSPKQMGEILFNRLGLKAKNQKKTGGGNLSTKESELEKMRDMHPIVPLIFDYRELQKLLSTYIDVISKILDKKDRLHAKFLQTGTTTGRMSSQEPNLQNIPTKSELGRNVRKVFIAEKGFKLVSFDYSQIELRIAAFLSGDKKLLEIFRNGEDVHTAVASEVFGVPLEKVDKEMRRRAKVINFGIMYGMGVLALKQNINSTREEAQKYLEEYFRKFSGLAKYLDSIKAEAERNGFTETLFGRRRYFEGLKSPLPYIRAMAERMAINAPIQGTEADIIKLSMIKVDEFLHGKKLTDKVRLILQVHDELVYEIEEKLVETISKDIKNIMESVVSPEQTKGVVCKTDVSVGDNWRDMEGI